MNNTPIAQRIIWHLEQHLQQAHETRKAHQLEEMIAFIRSRYVASPMVVTQSIPA